MKPFRRRIQGVWFRVLKALFEMVGRGLKHACVGVAGGGGSCLSREFEWCCTHSK